MSLRAIELNSLNLTCFLCEIRTVITSCLCPGLTAGLGEKALCSLQGCSSAGSFCLELIPPRLCHAELLSSPCFLVLFLHPLCQIFLHYTLQQYSSSEAENKTTGKSLDGFFISQHSLLHANTLSFEWWSHSVHGKDKRGPISQSNGSECLFKEKTVLGVSPFSTQTWGSSHSKYYNCTCVPRAVGKAFEKIYVSSFS